MPLPAGVRIINGDLLKERCWVAGGGSKVVNVNLQIHIK